MFCGCGRFRFVVRVIYGTAVFIKSFGQPKYSTPKKKILLRCVDFCFYFLHFISVYANTGKKFPIAFIK